MKATKASRAGRILAALVGILTLVGFFPEGAAAYVGPGAGLSLLGAVWGLLAAVGTAIGFVVAWPLRRFLRLRRDRRRERRADATHDGHPSKA